MTVQRPQTVSVNVTDDDTGTDTKSKSVTVSNVPPTIAISGAASVNEGSPYSLTLGAVTDPGTDTVTSYIVHWGDGNTDTYAANGVKTHTYADGPATRAITVDLSTRTAPTSIAPTPKSVTVNNVAPTIAISGAASVNEGSPYSLTLGAATDPGTDTVTSYIVHWGDGSPDGVYSTNGVKTHTYADGPATRAITVDLVDEDGTHLDRANAKSVSVLNVAPSTPSLVSPANGAITNDNTPTFDWTDSTDPAGANDTITYSLQVDNNGCTFPSPEINVSGLSASTYTPGSGHPGQQRLLLARVGLRRGRRHRRLQCHPHPHRRRHGTDRHDHLPSERRHVQRDDLEQRLHAADR